MGPTETDNLPDTFVPKAEVKPLCSKEPQATTAAEAPLESAQTHESDKNKMKVASPRDRKEEFCGLIDEHKAVFAIPEDSGEHALARASTVRLVRRDVHTRGRLRLPPDQGPWRRASVQAQVHEVLRNVQRVVPGK